MDLLKAIWRILAGISKVITVLVPLLFVVIFFAALSVSVSENAPKPLPEHAGLLIAPTGRLVEDRTPLEPLDALFANELSAETLLSTVIEGIDAATDDDRITSIVLDLENLAGPSRVSRWKLSKLWIVFQSPVSPSLRSEITLRNPSTSSHHRQTPYFCIQRAVSA